MNKGDLLKEIYEIGEQKNILPLMQDLLLLATVSILIDDMNDHKFKMVLLRKIEEYARTKRDEKA